jgi:tetratricopeptide (TPR) repeat protein
MTFGYYDLGRYSRPVTTSSPQAQLWFDRGLNWCYGYHHAEAETCFRNALAHDPECALAWWGLAYVNGCNYNKPWVAFDPDDARRSIEVAFSATRSALALQERVTREEALLIGALPHRYQQSEPAEDLERWNDDFASAMRTAYEAAPHDLEIAAIFAEALMNRTPWQLWDIVAGAPAPGADTGEIVAVLEAGLRLPGGHAHPGLLHLYIHALEMSPYPERALAAANALRDLVPDAGHLRHMPTHIDVLVGDYDAVIRSNSRAIEADRKFLERAGPANFYSLYRCHNYHFRIYGAMFAGQYQTAIETADEMVSTLPEEVLRIESPPLADWLEGFVSVRQHVLVRFGKWHDIIRQELPENRKLFAVTTAMTWYAKAVANGVIGDVRAARECASQFEAAYAEVPPSRYIFNNRCLDILDVGRQMMLGEIAYREADYETAFAHLRRSVELDDNLPYDEPWGWMQPARHALGALLLEQGHVEEAFAVYRADLGLDPVLPRPCRHPDNIWSLKGYHECLTLLGRHDEAGGIEEKIRRVEGLADVSVTVSCFCRKSVA